MRPRVDVLSSRAIPNRLAFTHGHAPRSAAQTDGGNRWCSWVIARRPSETTRCLERNPYL